MARLTTRLTAKFVEKQSTPGRYPDGDCLFLAVANGDSKSWVLRLKRQGKVIERGLGSVRQVSLAQARELAEEQAPGAACWSGHQATLNDDVQGSCGGVYLRP